MCYDCSMKQKELEGYKEMLEKEKNILLEGILHVAVPNPNVEGDWIPGDKKSLGNKVDELKQESRQEQRNHGITQDLEPRLSNVIHALEKIERGEFGICEVSGMSIEKERLDANPAARTNIANKDNDLSTIK